MARTRTTPRRNLESDPKRARLMEYSSDDDDEPSNDAAFPSTMGALSPYLAMFNKLALNTAKDKNFVFSPCSIHLVMSLLANGSSGSTLRELVAFSESKTLDDLNSVAVELVNALSSSTKKGPKLSFVSGIWVDQSVSLNPSFKSIAESSYKSKAEAVDFSNHAEEVSDEVNEWVKVATNGLIESLVSKNSFGNGTKLTLANAIYFKAKWPKERKFRKDSTEDSTFYLLGGESVEVPFMFSGRDQYIKVLDDCKVLRLPYRKSIGSKQHLSMHIILPNERDGLRHLTEKLRSDMSLVEIYLGDNKELVKVDNFQIPKFKIAFEFEASVILKQVGLQLPFSDMAEFSEMVEKLKPGEWLKVSQVIQKSYIEVNEEGTEAASSTIVCVMFGSAPRKPVDRVDFVADHPFIFVIRDEKSGVVLFIGHVVNPLLR